MRSHKSAQKHGKSEKKQKSHLPCPDLFIRFKLGGIEPKAAVNLLLLLGRPLLTPDYSASVRLACLGGEADRRHRGRHDGKAPKIAGLTISFYGGAIVSFLSKSGLCVP